MREEWPKIALGEVATLYDSLHKTPKYSDDGYPMVRVTDIKGETLDTDSCKRVNEETFLEFTKKRLPQKGDILFSRVGSYGNSLLVKTKEHFCLGQNTVSIVANSDAVLPEYMFAFLNSHEAKAQIESFIGGASQPTISLGNIKRILVPQPPLAQQYRISSVLSSYNDLIENNARRIEILEEMARRLYEEWFVHFRFPGHEEVSFKESELGVIPEGWEVKELGDVAQINPDAIKPKSAPDEIHYIDIASVSPGQIDKAETMLFSNAPGRARRIVRSGDVLWSCVRPNRRSCAMIVEPRENTIASTGFAVLRAGAVSTHYLYQHVRADHFVSYLVNRATGAAYPAVKAADFKEAKIILPQRDILSDFDKAVAPMRSLIHRLDRKNANLRAQRDLLLPKLVSGEIDVSDIPMPEDKEV